MKVLGHSPYLYPKKDFMKKYLFFFENESIKVENCWFWSDLAQIPLVLVVITKENVQNPKGFFLKNIFWQLQTALSPSSENIFDSGWLHSTRTGLSFWLSPKTSSTDKYCENGGHIPTQTPPENGGTPDFYNDFAVCPTLLRRPLEQGCSGNGSTGIDLTSKKDFMKKYLFFFENESIKVENSWCF